MSGPTPSASPSPSWTPRDAEASRPASLAATYAIVGTTRHAIHLAMTSETGTPTEARRIQPSGGPITINRLAPGAYTIDIPDTDPASTFAPAGSDILIWENPQTMPSAG